MESVLNSIRSLGGTLRGIVDQINPLSETNVTLFFIWLAVFTLTGVAVWRAKRRWLRGVLYLVHQVFTIGIVINWLTVVIVAINFWWQACLVAATCACGGWWLCRERKPPTPARVRIGAPK
jgi:hypothetical protein